jgi:hypothetical protein
MGGVSVSDYGHDEQLQWISSASRLRVTPPIGIVRVIEIAESTTTKLSDDSASYGAGGFCVSNSSV